MLAALPLLSLTSACSSISATEAPPTGAAEHVCRSWQIIRPSRKDVLTPGTTEQIVGNNAARETWCPAPRFASVTARA